MTPEQKTLVRESFARIQPFREQVAARFYARLFEMDPALRPMFQVGIKSLSRKFMEMLQTAVDHLDELDRLVPVFWQLGKRHADYGVKQEQYETVRNALLQTFECELGDAFTRETRDAWQEVYSLMSTTMKRASADS